MRTPLLHGWIDPYARCACVGGIERRLTAREAALAAHLIGRRPAPVSVDELLIEVWGVRADTRTHTVQSTLYTLRCKVERVPRSPEHFVTVRGQGYRFVAARGGTPLSLLSRLLAVDPMVACRLLEATWARAAPPKERVRWALDAAWALQRTSALPLCGQWLSRAAVALGEVGDRAEQRALRHRLRLTASMLAWRRGEVADASGWSRSTPDAAPRDAVEAVRAAFHAAVVDTGASRRTYARRLSLPTHGFAAEGFAPGAAVGALELTVQHHLLGDTDGARHWAALAATHAEPGTREALLASAAAWAVADEAADSASWATLWSAWAERPRCHEPFGWPLWLLAAPTEAARLQVLPGVRRALGAGTCPRTVEALRALGV